jgi:hypothetical protein
MADLASIIAGTDPMAPLELQTYQALQRQNAVNDASQWANQGLAGALARTIAGFTAPSQAQNALSQIVAQRQAAYPDIVKMLAAPQGAAQYAVQNPNISSLALAMAANQTPKDALEGQGQAIQNQLLGLNLKGFQNAQQGAISTPAVSPIAAPVVNKVPQAAPPATALNRTSAPSATANPAPVSGIIEPDPAALAVAKALPPQQMAGWTPAARAKWWAGQPPAVQQAYRQLYGASR